MAPQSVPTVTVPDVVADVAVDAVDVQTESLAIHERLLRLVELKTWHFVMLLGNWISRWCRTRQLGHYWRRAQGSNWAAKQRGEQWGGQGRWADWGGGQARASPRWARGQDYDLGGISQAKSFCSQKPQRQSWGGKGKSFPTKPLVTNQSQEAEKKPAAKKQPAGKKVISGFSGHQRQQRDGDRRQNNRRGGDRQARGDNNNAKVRSTVWAMLNVRFSTNQ